MRSKRLFAIILSSFLAGCATTGGDRGRIPVPRSGSGDLGQFDSDILKISWFRIAPAMQPEPGEKMRGRVDRGVPEYSVIYSYGWMRRFGGRSREPYLKGVGEMMWGFAPGGVKDEKVREQVRLLIKNGLFKVPATERPPSPELLKQLRRRATDPGEYEAHWKWARIIVVESDRGRRIIFPYAFRARKDLLEQYRKLDFALSQIMLLHAPRSGVRSVRDDHE